jgi:hypothetical protein
MPNAPAVGRAALCATLPAVYKNSNFDEVVKSQKINSLSFRRKPESSDFNTFWMPDPSSRT